MLSKISPDATESPSSFTKDKVAPSVNDACTSTINLITSVVPVSVLFWSKVPSRSLRTIILLPRTSPTTSPPNVLSPSSSCWVIMSPSK